LGASESRKDGHASELLKIFKLLGRIILWKINHLIHQQEF